MPVNYDLPKPTPGTSRSVSPTETEILEDVSDTIADIDTRLDAKQPADADLTTIAGLDSSTAGAMATDGAGWIRKTYAQLKTALGLVKADVGLGNVDNTSDANKPVSTAQQAALDAKAPLSGEYAVNTVAASGATETLTLAPAHQVTMDQSCTFTFPTPTTSGHTFLLRLSGAFTPTFPASVDWDSATAPTYATPSLYGFTTLDGGTTWMGSLIAGGIG